MPLAAAPGADSSSIERVGDGGEGLRAKLEPIADAYAVSLDKKGLPGTEMLADIRRLTVKYNGMSADELMRLAIDHPVQIPQ